MLSTFSWENDSAWSESCRSGWRWNKLVAVDTTVVLVTSCCDCFLWCLSMEPQHSVILVMSGDRKQSSLAEGQPKCECDFKETTLSFL